MIDVAILSIIRRWHFRDHVPLREIAQRLAWAGVFGDAKTTLLSWTASRTIATLLKPATTAFQEKYNAA